MQKLIKFLLISSLAVLSIYSFGPSAETLLQKKKAPPVSAQPEQTSPVVKTDADPLADNKIPPITDSKIESIKAKIKAAYPQVTIDTVTQSPIKDWLEINAGNNVLYVSEDSRYVMVGELLDITLNEDDRNLTENARRKFRVKLLDNLNPKDMVIYPVKEGKEKRATVLAFVDSDCGYCQKLHEESDKLAEAGIELRYLAFPRAGVGSPTYTHMVSAWCADNPLEAFNAIMKHQEIPAKECTNPVSDQFLLGQKLGLSGTPTLFFEDGTMIPGYMPADKLAEEAVKHKVGTIKPK